MKNVPEPKGSESIILVLVIYIGITYSSSNVTGYAIVANHKIIFLVMLSYDRTLSGESLIIVVFGFFLFKWEILEILKATFQK
jgi:hypothetical protein